MLLQFKRISKRPPLTEAEILTLETAMLVTLMATPVEQWDEYLEPDDEVIVPTRECNQFDLEREVNSRVSINPYVYCSECDPEGVWPRTHAITCSRWKKMWKDSLR